MAKKKKKLVHRNKRLGQVVSIDVLPDDVLLEIIDFYLLKHEDPQPAEVLLGTDLIRKIVSWQSLVHVCRRWRGLVFGSPRRLNLQLRVYYRPGALARKRKSLEVWPALPLLIHGHVLETTVDDIIAELEHTNRICQIILDFLNVTQIEVENIWTAMQVPFPELESISLIGSLRAESTHVLVLPNSFLGASAPRLRFLDLRSISFRGLPSLLMSTTHLVHLSLSNIPHSGYIPPDSVATCISMLTSLEHLLLDFESPQSSPEQEHRRSLPPTRSILPALTSFKFKGVHEYLEELVARIDTPKLELLKTTFFNDVDFDTQELAQFVSRLSTFKAHEARLCFDSRNASIKLLLPQLPNDKYFELDISCREPHWQLSSLAQICTTFLHLLSTTENLLIFEQKNSKLNWKDGIENIEWLELLLPFSAVKNFYLSKKFAPRFAPALQEISEGGATEALSNLQNLYLEGFKPSKPVQEGIERFISGRRLTNHPVAISVWDRGLDKVSKKLPLGLRRRKRKKVKGYYIDSEEERSGESDFGLSDEGETEETGVSEKLPLGLRRRKQIKGYYIDSEERSGESDFGLSDEGETDTITYQRELREAEMDSDFDRVLGRLLSEWYYTGASLLSITAVDTTVFGFSSGSGNLFGVDSFAKRSLIISTVAAAIGLFIDIWFIFAYSGADVRKFHTLTVDIYGSFFALSSRLPLIALVISVLALVGFLGAVAWVAWPTPVLVMGRITGVLVGLQFIVYFFYCLALCLTWTVRGVWRGAVYVGSWIQAMGKIKRRGAQQSAVAKRESARVGRKGQVRRQRS